MNIQTNTDFHTDESFEKLFEESIENEKKEGTVVKGTIVSIIKDMALVEVSGLKSEGLIPLKEFKTEDGGSAPEIGQEYDVYIERTEGRGGQSVLSREKAFREEAWFKFEELHNHDANVEGKIIGRVKGGFAVELGGIVAFLPGSQIDIRPIKDISVLLDIQQPFKILKMDKEQGNVVVSRRAILEESRAEARDELLSKIEEGTVLDGVVKNITDYGAFLDLGPIDGLLHITDISWSKISHPSEVLTLGETLKVIVIKYNKEIQRISLGLKQLEKNPWEDFESKYKVGEKFKGRVTTVTDYGAFVELEPNVEGLVYHTEISWNAKNAHPRKLINPDEEVEVVVLEIDVTKHRISLSIRKCSENPWEKFVDRHPVGSEVEGVVQNVADFGVFIMIDADDPDKRVEALVPAIELSWDGKQEDELKKYKPGDVVKGVVLTSDIERERITVGVKQLTSDSVSSAMSKYSKGSTVTCTVTGVKKDCIEVEVDSVVNAIIKKIDLSKHKSEQRCEKFGVGDKVDAKVTAVDAANRKLSLSIKALEIDAEKKAIQEYGSTDSGASLGDILGAALGQNTEEKKAEKSVTKSKAVAEEAKEEEKPKAKAKAPAKKAATKSDDETEETPAKKKASTKKTADGDEEKPAKAPAKKSTAKKKEDGDDSEK